MILWSVAKTDYEKESRISKVNCKRISEFDVPLLQEEPLCLEQR